MQDIRVLILIPTFYPLVGGAETNVLETSIILVKNGFKITIITRQDNESPYHEDVNGIKIIRCRHLGSRYSNTLDHFTIFISILLKSIKTVFQGKYDLLHTHIAHYPLLIGIILKLFIGKKLLVTVHGSDLNVYGKKPLFRSIIAWALRRADKVIVVSKDLGGLAREMGLSRRKVIYIPNGVDIKFFHPRVFIKYDYDVLFFGGIKWQKGLDYLLNATKTLVDQGVNLKVAIAGSGPYLKLLMEKTCYLGIEGNICFLGELNSLSLRDTIWKSKLVVFPSVSEGLPCSLLEAMACSKPIVATAVGGIKNVIKNGVNGILIPPQDSKAIAYSILLLTHNHEMELTLSKKARETVVNEYSWEKVTDKIVDTYSSLII